ncbi:hypothetical protein OH76DRAFT_776573 [Lentinus brumalis]|uniref:Uncharacterized protein n=1 Tax=Lentinus brumalis TaxID=2498619 RepID=A0A371D4C4_9APHY|nr:hypothetical protein OH76DRAFT_776573 [Polyporus brumalis]
MVEPVYMLHFRSDRAWWQRRWDRPQRCRLVVAGCSASLFSEVARLPAHNCSVRTTSDRRCRAGKYGFKFRPSVSRHGFGGVAPDSFMIHVLRALQVTSSEALRGVSGSMTEISVRKHCAVVGAPLRSHHAVWLCDPVNFLRWQPEVPALRSAVVQVAHTGNHRGKDYTP